MLSFAKIIYDIWPYAENENMKPNPRKAEKRITRKMRI